MLLGDFFLRSAYVVYDLTNNRIGIAQSNYNSSKSNIVEVPSGAASIPQITGASPSSTGSAITSSTSSTSSATTSSANNSPAAATTQTSTTPPSSTPSSVPDNHAVAIGVGVAVPVIVLIAAAIGFFCWRRKRTIATAKVTGPQVHEIYGSNRHQKGPISPITDVSELPSQFPSPAIESEELPDTRYIDAGIVRSPNNFDTHELSAEPEVHESPAEQHQVDSQAGQSVARRPLSGPLEDMPGR